jgi:chaperonin GroES
VSANFSTENIIVKKGGENMKIKPMYDRIMVEVLDAKDITKGGIVLPDTAKEKPQEAKVIAVGEGRVSEEGKTVPLKVKAGDVILFGKYSGTEITVSDKEYLILKEEDVLAVVK